MTLPDGHTASELFSSLADWLECWIHYRCRDCGEYVRSEYLPPPELQEFVWRQTVTQLELNFSPLSAEIRAEMLRFYQSHRETADIGRTMLSGQWRGHGVLHDAFDLERDVFQTVEQDGGWDEAVRKAGHEPGDVPDELFMSGFWVGLEKYLEANP